MPIDRSFEALIMGERAERPSASKARSKASPTWLG
jgi:hypothetical protein